MPPTSGMVSRWLSVMANLGFEPFANFRLESYGGTQCVHYVFVHFTRLRQCRPVSNEWPALLMEFIAMQSQQAGADESWPGKAG